MLAVRELNPRKHNLRTCADNKGKLFLKQRDWVENCFKNKLQQISWPHFINAKVKIRQNCWLFILRMEYESSYLIWAWNSCSPANVHDCICCIHHYVFVCTYTMMSLLMALWSPVKNHSLLPEFLSRGLRCKAQIHELTSGPACKAARRCRHRGTPGHSRSWAALGKANAATSPILGRAREDLSLQKRFVLL